MHRTNRVVCFPVAFLFLTWVGEGLGSGVSTAELSREPKDGATHPSDEGHLSLADTRFTWPSWEHAVRVITMRDYNTRVVTLGTLMLGLCAGIVGTFTLLRRRSLVGDVVSHAALPGIGIAFLVGELVNPGSGKSLPILLTGAFLAGILGVLCTIAIPKYTRIKEDASLAIVLSVFFGCGIVLFTVIQNIPRGNAAGLQQFIFGKTASMIASDVQLIGSAAAVVLVISGLFYKEFSLLCFDDRFASTQGWPVTRLDIALMAMVVGVTILGLQSVGLLLVVALLIIPAAAARFWTDRLANMTVISASLGGLVALLGVLVSSLLPRAPAGSIIVLVGAVVFVLSMLFGSRRGTLKRLARQWSVKRSIGGHDVLRASYEYLESVFGEQHLLNQKHLTQLPISFAGLLAMRSWSKIRLERLLARVSRDKLINGSVEDEFFLTLRGEDQARRLVRNHRLWELYLIHYADIAPSHVDRDADDIEHVLEPDVLEELEVLLTERLSPVNVPTSPHAIGRPENSRR